MGILDMFNNRTPGINPNTDSNVRKPQGLLTVDPNTGLNMAQVIGAAMLGNGRGTPGAGYQQGMQNWQTMLQNNRANNVDNRDAEMHALKMQEYAKKQEQAKAQNAQLSEWIASLPPEQQLAARVNPQKAMAAFHEAKKRNIKSVDGGLFDVTNNKWIVGRKPTAQKAPTLQKVIDPVTGKPKFVTSQQALGMQPYTSKGQSLSVAPDGTVSFNQGGSAFNANSGGLITPENQKPTKNELQKRQIDTIQSRANLNRIKAGYKPEYQTIQGQMGNLYLAAKDKVGLTDGDEQKRLGEFTTYKQDAFIFMNEEIKRLTGAAMAEAEAVRLRKGMPDPEKDSPTQYKAKLDNTIKALDSALVRHQYAQLKGLDFTMLPLNKAQILNKYGDELEPLYKQKYPDASDAQIESMVKAQLRRELGGM